MYNELNLSVDIDIKDKKIYISEENGSGTEYNYENINDISEIMKSYLEDYHYKDIEEYSELLKIKKDADFIYGFLKEQNDTEWIDLEKLKVLQDEGYVLLGDGPQELQKRLDKLLEKLWEGLEDIPFCEEDSELHIEEDYLDFKEGTSREDIWHWFDERYSKGVYSLLYEYENKENNAEEEEEELQ